MSTRPESSYVHIATCLQRPGFDLERAKALCLDLARQVDSLLADLSGSNRLAAVQIELIDRLRADKQALREQLDEWQRADRQRGNTPLPKHSRPDRAGQESQ